jgi:ComF family protein
MTMEGIRRRLAGWQGAQCVLCGAATRNGGMMCGPCRADLPCITVCCACCATPLPVQGLCGRCQRHPPPYNHVRAAFSYQAPVDFLIQRMKFSQRLGYARLLGDLMMESLRGEGDIPEAIIPVPLHKARLRQRGYNQAVELARPVARAMGVKIDHRSCVRTRATPSQVSLDAALRRRNVRGAFDLVRSLEYRHVAIVDDVMTTGSTVAELARLLRRNGIERVDAWICARAAVPL